MATRLGIEIAGRAENEIAREVAATVVNKERVDVLSGLGLVPRGIDHEISEIMHRTLYGVDADAVNLLLAGLRCAVADLAGCYMGTDLADILFGIPKPVISSANLGTLKSGFVNIALHGHNPVVSEVLVAAAKDLEEKSKAAGAAGINLVGVCCTGNEILMRHGIAACTHSVSQEMALMTGAVDAMVVDYQCIMPSMATVAECNGTSLITTMEIAKITGATHVAFSEEEALEKAEQIIGIAINNFSRRKGKPVDIPDIKETVVAGFSVEAIVAALSKLNAEAPLKPLVDHIVSGNIRGVCLFARCNNVKVPQDRNFVAMAVAVAQYLGVDTDKLPVVASAPEAVSEKAVSIGAYAVAAGLPTHVGVMLDNGRSLACEMVFIGKGVVPNTALLRGSGIDVAEGVIADDYTATSAAGVFTAGDVAMTYDPVLEKRIHTGLWTNAVEMGRCAGFNMAGKPTAYTGTLGILNATQIGNEPFVSMGVIHTTNTDYQTHISSGSGFYRKIVFSPDGRRLAGAVLSGDISGAGLLRAVMRERRPVDAFKSAIINGRLHYGHFLT